MGPPPVYERTESEERRRNKGMEGRLGGRRRPTSVNRTVLHRFNPLDAARQGNRRMGRPGGTMGMAAVLRRPQLPSVREREPAPPSSPTRHRPNPDEMAQLIVGREKKKIKEIRDKRSSFRMEVRDL